MKAAVDHAAAAGLGLHLDQLVVTGQREGSDGDRVLGCLGYARPAARWRRRLAGPRRARRRYQHSECSWKPHGTTHELGASRRVKLGGKCERPVLIGVRG